jgi:hypothetical protein
MAINALVLLISFTLFKAEYYPTRYKDNIILGGLLY